jgi:hypothetical protein
VTVVDVKRISHDGTDYYQQVPNVCQLNVFCAIILCKIQNYEGDLSFLMEFVNCSKRSRHGLKSFLPNANRCSLDWATFRLLFLRLFTLWNHDCRFIFGAPYELT